MGGPWRKYWHSDRAMIGFPRTCYHDIVMSPGRKRQNVGLPQKQEALVLRRFSELGEAESAAPRGLKPLHAFYDRSALVILGDPGMGKTAVFKTAAGQPVACTSGTAAQREPGARYFTVRDFNALGCDGAQVLYLDGLDEVRAGKASGSEVLDRMRGQLNEMGRPRFRLSCRAADWYGGIDKVALSGVSPDGQITVLRLEPLSEDDIYQIVTGRVADSAHFVREAERRGISDLLVNPQTLNMVVETVVRYGTWPNSRHSLYDTFCGELLAEQNPEHTHAERVPVSAERLRLASGALCAAHLCADTVGLALGQSTADAKYPLVTGLVSDTEAALSAARRPLFTVVGTTGAERVVPCHRTVAEFLAAEHMARQIREGLPVQRAFSLFTAPDGGIPTAMRGLCGWLASHSPDAAEAIIHRDPFGLVVNGDAGRLSPEQRRRLLDRIAELEERDQWCRAGAWTPKPFGALASIEMVPYFKDALADAEAHPVRADCVLDALEHGAPLAALGDCLLSMAGDANLLEELRVSAVHALNRACPHRLAELRAVADAVRDGRLPDTAGRLRAAILDRLYPEVIGSRDVVGYLGTHKMFPDGAHFSWFVTETLLRATDAERLPELLDAVAAIPASEQELQRYTWLEFLGKLLVAGLDRSGDRVPPARLWVWLGIGLGEHGEDRLHGPHAETVRQWFRNRPQKARDLFQLCIQGHSGAPDHYFYFRFWGRLRNSGAPTGFVRWLLAMAASELAQDRAESLFNHAMQLAMWEEDADRPSLDDLFVFTDVNARFAPTFSTWLYVEFPDWRLEDATRRQARRIEEERDRLETIQWLTENLEVIRTGNLSAPLAFLGELYYGRFIDVDRDASPWKRIEDTTSPEITSAARAGFAQCLSAPGLPTVEEISRLYARGRIFRITPAILAAMDEAAEGSPLEIARLSDATLEVALLSHFVYGTSERPWANWLMAARPGLSASVLGPFWRTLLTRRHNHLPGLYQTTREPEFAALAESTLQPLLRDFSGCPPSPLDDLLTWAIHYMDRGALAGQARSVLSRRVVRGPQRLYWYATAFLLDPAWTAPRLRAYVGRDTERVAGCVNRIAHDLGGERPIPVTLAPRDWAELIGLAGPLIWPRLRERSNGVTNVTPMMKAADALDHWIQRIAADPSAEAADALAILRADARMKAWHRHLDHARAVQAQKQRDDLFARPSVEQVVDTLRGGSPANPADFQALVVQTLEDLGRGWKDGDSDDYKRFWSEDRRTGKPTMPKGENSCRDQLIEPLRARLGRLGIQVEREGQFRDSKKGDLKFLCGDMVLPIEAKRHSNKELWTAPEKQLVARYTRDPRADGRGIYVVFWFGLAAGKVPRPPEGIKSPRSAEELKAALDEVVTRARLDRVRVVVLNCEKPSQSSRLRARRTPSRSTRGRR